MPPDPVEIRIEDLSHDGRGVGRVEGKAVFVHGALPGERIRFKYRSRRKDFDEGDTVEVLEPSSDRVTPRCAHFGLCGGCALQHLDGVAQTRAKQAVLEENLRRIGKVEPAEWLPPLHDEPWGYRRKARLSVRYVHGKGRVLVGFRERGGRFVADLDRCEVLVDRVGGRLPELAELIGSMEARDHIPQVEVAAGDDRCVLVFRHMQPLSEVDRARLADYERSSGLDVFLQSGGPDTVVPLAGDDTALHFEVPEEGLRYQFTPTQFVQVNAAMNRRMIALALDQLELAPGDRVLDLFCGLGNFTLPIARHCQSVVGVEGDPALVDLARHNAALNGLDQVRFEAADLTEDHADADWLAGGFDQVLIDPPRSGARDVLPAVAALQPRRIVYISCHPGSLARDAGALVHEHGFVLVRAGVMDMFPQTAHVESIAVFEADRGD